MKRSMLVLACCSLWLLACESQTIEGPTTRPPLILRFDELEEPTIAGLAVEEALQPR